uniref:Uncharacterized protein n=1 Tax=Peronospora matthiolae TaxID=2874970 RepID=A0AAV1TEA6_9STRA
MIAFLHMIKFAMNNAVHESTGLTPLFFNNARHTRPHVLLGKPDLSTLGGGGIPDDLATSYSAPATTSPHFDRGDYAEGLASTEDTTANASPCDHNDPRTVSVTSGLTSAVFETAVITAHARSSTRGNYRPLNVDDTTWWVTESSINLTRRSDHFRHSQRASPTLDSCSEASPTSDRLNESADIKAFVQQRQFVTRFVCDAIANAVDKQKAAAEKRGRTNHEKLTIGDKVLLSKTGISDTANTNVG